MVETSDNSMGSEENVRKVRKHFIHSLGFMFNMFNLTSKMSNIFLTMLACLLRAGFKWLQVSAKPWVWRTTAQRLKVKQTTWPLKANRTCWWWTVPVTVVTPPATAPAVRAVRPARAARAVKAVKAARTARAQRTVTPVTARSCSKQKPQTVWTPLRVVRVKSISSKLWETTPTTLWTTWWCQMRMRGSSV